MELNDDDASFWSTKNSCISSERDRSILAIKEHDICTSVALLRLHYCNGTVGEHMSVVQQADVPPAPYVSYMLRGDDISTGWVFPGKSQVVENGRLETVVKTSLENTQALHNSVNYLEKIRGCDQRLAEAHSPSASSSVPKTFMELGRLKR